MLYSTDFPEGFRAAVELRGFRLGRSRQPLSPGQQVNREELQRLLQCILADFGYVEPPAEGCPVRPVDELKRHRVNQIVGDVLRELSSQGGDS